MGLVYITEKITNQGEIPKVKAAYRRRNEKQILKNKRVNLILRLEKNLHDRLKSFEKETSTNACINALLLYALDNLDASNSHLIAWEPKED